MASIAKAKAPLETAIAALGIAENSLRQAAAIAAASGSYDDVVVITRWAKSVQSLLTEESARTSPPPSDDAQSVLAAEKVSLPFSAVRNVDKPASPALRVGVPNYSREADFLVKNARSRKSRVVYEHRAPADVVAIVAECLAEWRTTRSLLTADQLLEAFSKRKGSVVSYQIYVVLGWFVQIGLVRRHGRTGYSVPNPNTICDDVRKAWSNLGITEKANS